MSDAERPFRRWLNALLAAGIVTAPLFLAFVVLFGPVVLMIPYSWYSAWLRGYSTIVCEAQSSGDTVSPSGRWTARIDRGEGCDFGSGPWLDVALIPNDRPRFLARHRWVFYRGLDGVRPGNAQMAIRWIDDYSLELRTPPCAPACQKWSDAAKDFVPTGPVPCETTCVTAKPVAGVKVVITPPEK